MAHKPECDTQPPASAGGWVPASERLDELADILAAGLMRLHGRRPMASMSENRATETRAMAGLRRDAERVSTGETVPGDCS